MPALPRTRSTDRARDDRVVLLLAVDRVLARAAEDPIGAASAAEQVVARPAADHVVVAPAVQLVVAGTAGDQVLAPQAGDAVAVGAAVEDIAIVVESLGGGDADRRLLSAGARAGCAERHQRHDRQRHVRSDARICQSDTAFRSLELPRSHPRTSYLLVTSAPGRKSLRAGTPWLEPGAEKRGPETRSASSRRRRFSTRPHEAALGGVDDVAPRPRPRSPLPVPRRAGTCMLPPHATFPSSTISSTSRCCVGEHDRFHVLGRPLAPVDRVVLVRASRRCA